MAGTLSGEPAGRVARTSRGRRAPIDHGHAGRGSDHSDAGVDARSTARTGVPDSWPRRPTIADSHRGESGALSDCSPHRVEKLQVSKDPQFVEKVRDIVGLYLNPPNRAIVLCVDEKSQVSGAEPHPADSAAGAGGTGTTIDDLRRHGVTSLFAAWMWQAESRSAVLPTAPAPRVPAIPQRHRRDLPRGFEVHLVMDNYGTHKVSKVRTWLAAHPRYHVH